MLESDIRRQNDPDMKMSDIGLRRTSPQPPEFYEHLSYVERRPGMYLRDDSVTSVELYLEGYDAACGIHGKPRLLLGLDFTKWLKRSKVSILGGGNIAWSSLITINTPEGGDAFAAFFSFFREYHTLTSGYEFPKETHP